MSDRTAPPAGPPRPPRPGDEPPSGDHDAAVATARLALRFGLLVTAGLLALSLPLPWRLGGLVFVLAGLVVGVQALRAAARARSGAGPIVVLSLGLVVTALVLGAQLLLLVAWPVTAELERCEASALTDRAQRACQEDFQRSVESWLLPGR